MGLNVERANLALGAGSVVLGKFRIDRMIAEGGMGIVVAATHLQLEQTVVLKFLRGDLGGHGEALMRFMREAQAAAQLRSEHVARVLDVGATEDGTPFMVMEYLEGLSLDTVIAERGPLDISDAAEFAIQTCEGLAEAHARGIVHRDIKPSNLFLVDRSPGWRTIKILDFGISKVSLTRASNITTNLNMGTPCYMSPEQIRSTATVDHRTDIWSLGSTLYELLAGRPPFDPTLPLLALPMAIANDEPPSLRELRPEVPEELAAIVSCCMAKDREARFDSAAALSMALLPFTGHRARVSAERAVSITPAAGLRQVGALGAIHVVDATGHVQADQPPPPRAMTSTEKPSTIGDEVAPGAALPPPTSAVPSSSVLRLLSANAMGLLQVFRRWSRRQLITVACGAAFVSVVLLLALLSGKRSAPPSAGVLGPQARSILSAPPPTSRARLAPEPPSFSELVVRVSPPSARMTIDGLTVSGNPFRGRYRYGETHQIRAFAAGYQQKVEKIALQKDIVLDISLERVSAIVRPKGASPRPQQRVFPAAPAPSAPPVASQPTRDLGRDMVDPTGGRAPVRPIQIASPYKSP